MSAFAVIRSNQAAQSTNYRCDMDIHMQICQATDRRKMSLYEANLATFQGTTATRSTHCKFLVALLGEVEHYQRTNNITQVSSPKENDAFPAKENDAFPAKDLLQHIHKQHETFMAAFPDHDMYGQSVALIAHRRVFN